MNRLERIKAQVVVRENFYGNILWTVDMEESLKIKAIDTDGEKIYYNQKFIDDFDDEKLYYALIAVSMRFIGCIFNMENESEKWMRGHDRAMVSSVWGLVEEMISGWKDNPMLMADDIGLSKKKVVFAYNNCRYNGRVSKELKDEIEKQKVVSLATGKQKDTFLEFMNNRKERFLYDVGIMDIVEWSNDGQTIKELSLYENYIYTGLLAEYVKNNWKTIRNSNIQLTSIDKLLHNLPLELVIVFWRNISKKIALELAKKDKFKDIIDKMCSILK